ncbi:MAG: MupG family TIM beta-alpha barrel fold protein [Candidatus Nanopelagicales bacterium]
MSHLAAPQLGISLYLSEPESANLARVAAAPQRAITRAFTSLQIPEDTNAADQPRLSRRLGAATRAVGVRLYARRLTAYLAPARPPGTDDAARLVALADWGVSGVRFDDGFPLGVIASTSRRLPVQLNASNVTEAETAELIGRR